MAHLMIIVNSIGALDKTSDIFIGGDARTDDMTPEDATVYWQAHVSMSDLAASVNTAIKTAAIAAVGVAGFTVGPLDKKMVLGGAVGL